MGERCSHCHKAGGPACSRYSGRNRVLALQSCPHLSEVDRYREAASCDGATSGDRALAICKALQALSGESDEPFGDGAGLAAPFASASANAPNKFYGS